MVEFETYSNEKMGYEVQHATLDCGMDIYVVPSAGQDIVAHYGTKFGGNDVKFVDSSGKETTVPAGIAHFLEHKVFAKKDGTDIMNDFSAKGVYSNAWTYFSYTNYYIQFSEKSALKENVYDLLSFVSELNIDKASVDKERGIIVSEKNGKMDNPSSLMWEGLEKALFHHTIPEGEILGTKENIEQDITVQNLTSCFNTFYHPSNMTLVVSGNIDSQDVASVAEEFVKEKEYTKAEIPTILSPHEPEAVNQKRIEIEKGLEMPMVAVAFKYNGYADVSKNPKERLKEQLILENVVESVFGSSSDFYKKTSESGIQGVGFYASHMIFNDFGFSCIDTTTSKTDEFENEVIEAIRRLKEDGINYEDFNRNIRKNIGQLAMSIGTAEEKADKIVMEIHNGYTMQQMLETYQSMGNVTEEEINQIINDHFDLDNYSTVIVK